MGIIDFFKKKPSDKPQPSPTPTPAKPTAKPVQKQQLGGIPKPNIPAFANAPQPSPGSGLYKTNKGQRVEMSQDEVNQQKSGGQEFVKNRNALAAQLIQQGHSPLGATRIAEESLAVEAAKEQMVNEMAMQEENNKQVATEKYNQALTELQQPIQPLKDNMESTIKGTLIGAGAAGLTAAGTSAIGGAIAGGGVLSVPAAATLAAGGFAVGSIGTLITKLTLEKKQNVNEAMANFKVSKKNMANVINMANRGELSGEDAIMIWRENVANIKRSEMQLKKLTKNSVEKFLSGAGDELIEVTGFIDQIPTLEIKLANAVATPNKEAEVNFGNDDEIA